MTVNNDSVAPQTTEQLLQSYTREMILLAGKDGCGKSCAICSMAVFVAMTQPDATFHVIDSEHKFGSALKSFGDDAPGNIRYWPVDNMNQATFALRTVLAEHKQGDWLAVESMSRMWERSQNLAYEAVAGVGRVEYLEAKLNTVLPSGVVRKASPVPKPDDFWAVAKGAHDGAFLDLITNAGDLNVVLTTTVKPPAKQRDNQPQWVTDRGKDQAILRAELGIDMNLDGAPRLPYYFETMCMLELVNGKTMCKVVRDNHSKRANTRPTFQVEDRKSFGIAFYSECR